MGRTQRGMEAIRKEGSKRDLDERHFQRTCALTFLCVQNPVFIFQDDFLERTRTRCCPELGPQMGLSVFGCVKPPMFSVKLLLVSGR